MKLPAAVLAAAAALLLSACNDGPEVPLPVTPAASNAVPASATSSAKAYEQYAASLMNSETQAPLDVAAVTPPTSETEAPLAL